MLVFCQKSGLNHTVVYNYLAGTNRPTAKNLSPICEALDIEFDRALEYSTPAPVGRPPWEPGTVLRPVKNRRVGQENVPLQGSSATDDESTTEPEETEGPSLANASG